MDKDNVRNGGQLTMIWLTSNETSASLLVKRVQGHRSDSGLDLGPIPVLETCRCAWETFSLRLDNTFLHRAVLGRCVTGKGCRTILFPSIQHHLMVAVRKTTFFLWKTTSTKMFAEPSSPFDIRKLISAASACTYRRKPV